MIKSFYMENLRETLRNLIYGAIGIICTFLVLRVIFDIAQPGDTSFLTVLINSISDIFIYPFKGIINITNINLVTINTGAVIGLGVYSIGGYLVAKIITGFMYDNLYDITQNFVDGFFKVFEFIVGLRILFEVFAVLPSLTSSAFVDTIFSWSEWTQSLLFRIPFGDGYINLSAIAWFIILIILDVFSGRYLAKVLGGTVVIASASTSVISKSRFKLPSFRKPAEKIETTENTPVYVDISNPPKA